MAARSVSPGGALLRTSRMFSLPTPIPPPPGDVLATYQSKSATTAFPTHQIISTPSSSRARGDWGLKRPLPIRKTTGTTYAMLRVKEVDSIEGITDYSSATDLGITLRKFQDLHLPVTVPNVEAAVDLNLPQPSAFEESHDFTAIDQENRSSFRDVRWKFAGPWLAGMSQGEFAQWVEKTVRPKRPEFRQFLKKRLAADLDRAAGEKALDNGEDAPPPTDPLAIQEEQLIDYLRKLRNNREALFDMVGEFLDLAPLRAPGLDGGKVGAFWGPLGTKENSYASTTKGSPYAERGPPVTHPSAGLSYLRTSSYLDNHPFYGPQKSHPPVQARVVRPRRRALGLDAKIGVAGFIADRPGGDTTSNLRGGGWAFDRMDLVAPGGVKIPVQPYNARVNSRGRLEITVGDADREALLVAKELLGDDETTTFRKPQKPDSQNYTPGTRASNIRIRYQDPKMSSAEQYGLRSDFSAVKSTFGA